MAVSTSRQPPDALIGEVCHFLAIPAELRLQIYLLLLLFPFPMDLGFRGCYTYLRSKMQHAQLTKHTASILFSCRTIRSEALPFFYTKNSFSICARTDLPKYLTSPYSTPLKLSWIRHLIVHTDRYKEIMDEIRAEEMKCFVGLQRLTVVRTRVYSEIDRRFVKRSVKEVCHGTTSKAPKAMLIERPHIACRLILVVDNYAASHSTKEYQVPKMELVFPKVQLQGGKIVFSPDSEGQTDGKGDIVYLRMITTFTKAMEALS